MLPRIFKALFKTVKPPTHTHPHTKAQKKNEYCGGASGLPSLVTSRGAFSARLLRWPEKTRTAFFGRLVRRWNILNEQNRHKKEIQKCVSGVVWESKPESVSQKALG